MNFGVDTVEKFHGKYMKTEDVFFFILKNIHDLSITYTVTAIITGALRKSRKKTLYHREDTLLYQGPNK